MGKIREEEKKRKTARRRPDRPLTAKEQRARRRRARKRIVIMQRIGIALFVTAVLGGGGALVWNLPSLKLTRQLDAGKEYLEQAAYNDAIESYEKALLIDSTSVKAYRCMAGAYLDMADEPNAKRILFEGWENTQDESLLQYYCTVILNEAVAEINEDRCSLETADKILSVLEQDTDNADALPLMHTAWEHLMNRLSDGAGEEFFYDMDDEAEYCNFTLYEQLMNRLFELYQADKRQELGTVISEYGMLDIDRLKLSRRHLDSYRQILEKSNEIADSKSRSGLLACLAKEEEISGFFADIFTQFDAGNYEAAKDFIVADAYTQLRDAFIEGTMEYWDGETSIPVSRETVVLERTEDGWTFSYPNFKDNEATAGVITVWGSKMTDSGVQRSSISYEPAEGPEGYYPHVEYVISYMLSNVQKKNAFKEEMNYHLETRTWTEDGMVTDMIGDWGGPYQWEKTY